jgi:hypothetical protein
MTRVLSVAADDPILWKLPLLPLDLQAVLDRAPPLRGPDTAATDTSWQARLNHGQSSLCKTLSERAPGSFVVSVDHRGASGRVSKSFTWFDSVSSFFAHTARMAPEDKHFHEVVEPGVWTKLYFDVEHYVATAEDPSRINECLFVLKQALLRAFPQITEQIHALDDVVLLSASRAVAPPPGAFKHSYHIIFPRIRFFGIARMKEFAQSVHHDPRLQARDRKGGAKSMLDVRVYNFTQSFRLIESCKIEEPGSAAVPLAYADGRENVSLRDLLRTVLTYDGDGDTCVRINGDTYRESAADFGRADTDALVKAGVSSHWVSENDSNAPSLAVVNAHAWPAGLTRHFDRDESSALAWMQFNFGVDGHGRLRAVRERFRQDGYVHFLLVQWRSCSQRYLFAFREDMEGKAQELHAVLRAARGGQVKDFGLGGKINTHGTASWVKAGYLVRDSRLGYLKDEVTGAEAAEGEVTGAEAAEGEVTGAEAVEGEVTGAEAVEGEVTGAEAVEGEVTGAEAVEAQDPESIVLWTRWHTGAGNRQGPATAACTPQKLPVPRDEGLSLCLPAEPKRRKLAFDALSPPQLGTSSRPPRRRHASMEEYMRRNSDVFPLDANGVPLDLSKSPECAARRACHVKGVHDAECACFHAELCAPEMDQAGTSENAENRGSDEVPMDLGESPECAQFTSGVVTMLIVCRVCWFTLQTDQAGTSRNTQNRGGGKKASSGVGELASYV